jgi:hypothetical protein
MRSTERDGSVDLPFKGRFVDGQHLGELRGKHAFPIDRKFFKENKNKAIGVSPWAFREVKEKLRADSSFSFDYMYLKGMDALLT